MLGLRLIALLLPLLAVGCGGGESATWGSPSEAADAGAAALASGDGAAAAKAFEAATAATDPAAKADALGGLFEAHLLAGSNEAAIAAIGRLVAECRASLTAESMNQLATLALNRRNVQVADAVVNKALALFPGQKALFAKAVEAVDLLKTQGPGADLSALGYAGG
jgi:hypothetical protein